MMSNYDYLRFVVLTNIGFIPIKWFNVSRLWDIKTGDHTNFWFKIVIFLWIYGQCFMPNVVIQQSSTLTEDLTYGILGYWEFHATPYGYMGC